MSGSRTGLVHISEALPPILADVLADSEKHDADALPNEAAQSEYLSLTDEDHRLADLGWLWAERESQARNRRDAIKLRRAEIRRRREAIARSHPR